MTRSSASEFGTSRIAVDLNALAANYRYLSNRSHNRCAGVVKANGYGLGIEPVVKTLVAQGCQDFFVATLDEALEVRALFPERRVVLLGGVVDAQAAEQAAQKGIEPALNSPEQARLWQPYRDKPATLHLDTGMQRLGFSATELAAGDWSSFNVRMVMTHLACADTPDNPANLAQLDAFQQCVRQFPNVPTSIANSAGCLLPKAWHGDLTRPGIGLYGGHPQNRIPDNPLSPVVHMRGRVVARRTVEAGSAVGYGGAFVAQRLTELAVVGLGYADGLPRCLSNTGEVSWKGARVPMVGRISMDLTHIDITDLVAAGGDTEPGVGDWVEFLGGDIGVDEVAQWAGTIGLEILCGLGRRPIWEYQHLS